MNFLDIVKDEMEKKRKNLEEVGGGKPVKYVKRSELEANREKKYLEEQRLLEEERKRKLEEKLKLVAGVVKGESSQGNSRENSVEKEVGISSQEVIKRLRKRGEPIRLFAESDEERVERLRHLEQMDSDSHQGQMNDFLKNMNEMDKDLDLEALKRKAEESHKDGDLDQLVSRIQSQRTYDQTPITTELYHKKRDKLYIAIHDYFLRLLHEWEEDLNNRPEEVKRSRKGKSDLAICQQSELYLQSLFDLLQKKQIPDDILHEITVISQHMQARDYVKANDAYFLLSIGNSAWPIGVTMVGIHERSAREKIHSNQVAHVLNDEKTRKWIQSMKRLMTFCQSKYPPDDLSRTVG